MFTFQLTPRDMGLKAERGASRPLVSGVFCHSLQLVNRNVAEFCNSKSKWRGVGGEGQPGGLSEDLHVILLVVTPLKGRGLSSYSIDRFHHGPYMGNVTV